MPGSGRRQTPKSRPERLEGARAARSHNTEEAELLERDGAGTVFVGEAELAHSMTRFVLERVAPATPGPG